MENITNEELKSYIVNNIMQQYLEKKRIDNATKSLQLLVEQMKTLEKELYKRSDGFVKNI